MVLKYYVTLYALYYFLPLCANEITVLDNFVGLIPEPPEADDEPKELKALYHSGYKWRRHNIFYDE